MPPGIQTISGNGGWCAGAGSGGITGLIPFEVVNDGAMLAISVVLIHHPNKPSSLEMPCLEGITVRMNLNQELVLALCNMLQLSAKEASWELGAGLVMAVPAKSTALFADNPEAKKILH